MNDFLITNLWWIVLLSIVVLAGGAFLIYFLVRSKKGKGVPAKEASEALVGAIGGMENVIDHSLAGSRITLRLKDDGKVEEQRLRSSGVTGFIRMSDRLVLVIPEKASEVYRELFGE